MVGTIQGVGARPDFVVASLYHNGNDHKAMGSA